MSSLTLSDVTKTKTTSNAIVGLHDVELDRAVRVENCWRNIAISPTTFGPRSPVAGEIACLHSHITFSVKQAQSPGHQLPRYTIMPLYGGHKTHWQQESLLPSVCSVVWLSVSTLTPKPAATSPTKSNNCSRSPEMRRWKTMLHGLSSIWPTDSSRETAGAIGRPKTTSSKICRAKQTSGRVAISATWRWRPSARTPPSRITRSPMMPNSRASTGSEPLSAATHGSTIRAHGKRLRPTARW